MLTKEEYLAHLDYGIETCPSIYDAFKELIEEHFKLKEKVYKLEKEKEQLIDEYTEEYQLVKEHKFKEFELERALREACNMLYEYNDILSQEEWKDWFMTQRSY